MSNLNIQRNTPVAVISWNNGASARAISQSVSNGRFLRKNDSPIPSSIRTVINMGCSSITRRMNESVRVLNRPEQVAIASSKVATFSALRGTRSLGANITPWSTEDQHEAVFHAVTNNKSIVCRTVDNGHSGAGIVLVTPDELRANGNLPRASVYVEAIQKRREYRVHVGRAQTGIHTAIDIARKVRRSGVEDGGVNSSDRPFIWNHGNDFIFQRGGVSNTDVVIRKAYQVAASAVTALALDFAAVDVVVEAGGPLEDARIFVLEVNTSPGMEGTTLSQYSDFFKYRTGQSDNFTPFFRQEAGFGDEYTEQQATA